MEPVAYVIFADNGNIRVWYTKRESGERMAEREGLKVTPLYSAASVEPLIAEVERLNNTIEYLKQADGAEIQRQADRAAKAEAEVERLDKELDDTLAIIKSHEAQIGIERQRASKAEAERNRYKAALEEIRKRPTLDAAPLQQIAREALAEAVRG